MNEKTEYQLKSLKNPIKYVGLVITLFVLLEINCFGQSITWQRTYDGKDHLSDGSFAVCKADGDNLYVAGTTTLLPNRRHIYVLKLNPFGDTIWTRTTNLGTNSDETANAIVSNNDGSCVITGDAGSPFAIKYDLNGNIVWNYIYGGGFKQCYSIITTSDGGYIACGRDAGCSTDCAYILKIDSTGGLQWQQTYPASHSKYFYSIIETNNTSGYIATGFEYSGIGDTTRGYILKIDYTGGVIWEKRYLIEQGSNVNSIIKYNSAYLIAGGSFNSTLNIRRLFFGKLNELGDTSNIKIFESNSNEYFGRFNIINNRKFVMASSKETFLTLNGHVFTFDTLGITINDKIYLTGDVMNLRYALPLTNGDIIFGGDVDFDSMYTRNDIYVLRTDSLLNAPPPIAINYQSLGIPVSFRLYQNFPNPFNPETQIKFDVPKSANIKIAVYDMLGREVAILVNGKMEPGVYNASWNATPYASGVYFYRLTSDDFVSVKKMIVLK